MFYLLVDSRTRPIFKYMVITIFTVTMNKNVKRVDRARVKHTNYNYTKYSLQSLGIDGRKIILCYHVVSVIIEHFCVHFSKQL